MVTKPPDPPEQRPSDRERQLVRLIEAVKDYAIFMLDAEGYVRTWNPGAQRLKGYTPDEIIGQHFSRFYTQKDKDRDHPAHELRVAVAEGRFEEQGWRVRKDGTQFWANVVISAAHDEEGRVVGFAKVTRDLSERRKQEQKLLRAQQELERSNADLEQFAASVAHDLAEPLRTVAGFAEVIGRRHADELSEEPRQYLDYIMTSVARMQTMINDLLAYARAGAAATAPAPVSVADAVESVLLGLRASLQEYGVEVTVDLSERPCVLGDQPSVELVLQNLISNAVKFADREQPRVTVGARSEDGRWRVEVSDNGIGIDPSDQRTIFQAFRRLNHGDSPGTGLGLSISQRIVTRLGGEIGVDSQVGQGSRFWFALPTA